MQRTPATNAATMSHLTGTSPYAMAAKIDVRSPIERELPHRDIFTNSALVMILLIDVGHRRDPLGKLPLRQRFPGLAQRVEDDPEQLAVSRKTLPRPAVGVFATEYRKNATGFSMSPGTDRGVRRDDGCRDCRVSRRPLEYFRLEIVFEPRVRRCSLWTRGHSPGFMRRSPAPAAGSAPPSPRSSPGSARASLSSGAGS